MADFDSVLSKAYPVDEEKTSNELTGPDLTLSAAMASYPSPFLPMLKASGNNENISRSSSSSSLNSLPRLKFRDHVWAYNQRYLAAEAIEEAMISAAEENGSDQEEGTDEMTLVQLLIACAVAVACRDKSHASVLLSELRSNALVFGSSFQRVASCFVQGLADRLAPQGLADGLALVHPLGIEQFYFPKENIISCEGPARLERDERVNQWRRRMRRSGFRAGPGFRPRRSR